MLREYVLSVERDAKHQASLGFKTAQQSPNADPAFYRPNCFTDISVL